MQKITQNIDLFLKDISNLNDDNTFAAVTLKVEGYYFLILLANVGSVIQNLSQSSGMIG